MVRNALSSVIPSRTRVDILVKLFLNPGLKAYLRQLASEFNLSTNAVRTELNHLTDHKILVSERSGRSVFYRANTDHPLFPELFSMVRKITGIDELVRSVVDRLGNVDAAYLVGDYARGIDTGIIDVVLVGDIDKVQLDDFALKTEAYIQRKIRSLVLTKEEFIRLTEKKSFDPIVRLWDQKDGINPKGIEQMNVGTG
ncbi:MAG: winged helix-turn-helix transcriptional regulator [Deltaproteobacteria bacterium]|nr:winged helix-turn-helix transcriptional regulator [Deltaproteobacteria bacterium]